MADDRIPWIDLSAYGITLHALRLPSGRVALVAAGNTLPHVTALMALGFRRTRQGHIVRSEPTLKLSAVRAHFSDAQVRELLRDQVVRIVPTGGPLATPTAPSTAPTPSSPLATVHSPTSETPSAIPSGNIDHLIHNATLLGVNRRGQRVYQDGAENRYLDGITPWDDHPLTDSDYLRAVTPESLPEVVAGLVVRAEQGEKLTLDDFRQLGRAIDAPWRTRPEEPSLHDLQEALEVATAQRFRDRYGRQLATWREGAPPEPAFHAAVHLSQNLPSAVTRVGQTLAWAQFSTPLPLAVAARILLGSLGPGRSVLEPTAGHGALLLGLPADTRITAVEIDPARARRLNQVLGGSNKDALEAPVPVVRILTGDILQISPSDKPYDYLLANPPYGALSQYQPTAGHPTRIRFGDVSFATQRIDHLILLHTLQQRHPQGRAVFLIGADHPRNHALDTPAGGSRYLFNLLGDQYHVEAVIGLHGDLYRNQGAHYPLRLVVIGEQGAGFPPVPEKTPVARTWNELWDWVKNHALQIGPSALERATPTIAPIFLPVTDHPLLEPVIAAPITALDTPPDALVSIEDELDEAVVFQERYVARSQIGEVTTMIPANMAAAVSRALDRVEADTGYRVDEYVAHELGRDPSMLDAMLAPEQIDAIALAFHAHDRGRGFIEADETGIGKGRVLAAVAVRAWNHPRPVIFLTEKPNLFSDFYRDLSHLGARTRIHPLIVNLGAPIKDTERGTVQVSATRPQDLQRFLARDSLPPGVNLVLATYSQLCRPNTPKVDWLCRMAEQTGALIIADESHNASGDSITAINVGRLIEASGHPPLFSSATYAKRPDNLAIYASVLPELFRGDDLGSMLRQGGAALQEVFSQMLAEDGVLIRREHDLSHITFIVEPDTAHTERNSALADQLASILEKMAWLGGDIEAFVSRENQPLNERFASDAGKSERKGHRAGLSTMNFGSRLYQLNRLFLLAIKVDHAIAFGDREIAAGRKPVFVLENTMETLLREIVTNAFEAEPDDLRDPADTPSQATVLIQDTTPSGAGSAGGEAFTGQDYPVMTYRDALYRVLNRMMQLTERDSYGNTCKRSIQEENLLALAHAIEQDIDVFPDLPLSPLDTVRIALQERGYRIGELSGRSFQVEWVECAAERRMRVRLRPPENRSDLIYRFNTDVYQGLILTRSGSTGLSLHARDDVLGWSPAPRTMFELQIPQNVAERIQFWGRVNRRGQCAPPIVVTPSSELPGETRLIAMQNAKLRQLSANTTSNQDNAALAKHIPDLLNPLGNQITRRWVTQNPVDATRLSAEISDDHDRLSDWYVNRVLSRILLFPVTEQEALLEELAGLYRAYLEELNSQGIQPLRTAEFDWKAREVARDTFEETPAVGRDADSPFHASIDFVTVEYEQARRPLRADRIRVALAQGAAFWKPEETLRAFLRVKEHRLAHAILPNGRYAGFSSVSEGLNAEGHNPVKRAAQQLGDIEDFLKKVQIGSMVAWHAASAPLATSAETEEDATPERELKRGLIVALHPPSRDALHLSGHYQVIIACPGAQRLKAVTLHSLQQGAYTLDPSDPPRDDRFAAFDAADGGVETLRRHLLTGNLYAALQLAARDDLGRPVIYTTTEGVRERGVLLHEDLTLKILLSQPVLLRSPEHLQQFVADHLHQPRTVLVSSDTGGRPERYKRGVDFVLILQDGAARLIVPGAHARNGALFHDPRWQVLDLTLEGNRTALEGLLPADALSEALEVLGSKYAWYAASDYRDWYNRRAAKTADVEKGKAANDQDRIESDRNPPDATDTLEESASRPERSLTPRATSSRYTAAAPGV